VLSVHDREWIVARLRAGSSMPSHRLDRLKVDVEGPTLRSPGMLRVGFPALGRSAAYVECGPGEDIVRVRNARYAALPGTGVDCACRAGGTPQDAPWPDTLCTRTYADAVDEEIALERGEIDVAAFWPGELDARFREDVRRGDRWTLVATRRVSTAVAADTLDAAGLGVAPCVLVYRNGLDAIVRALGYEPIASLVACGPRVASP
jgi:hypothetical protein